ncbi:MAG: D-glycero-beta-D-manno-heptose-7-phosphate kinase [Candidatus Abyssubacteria bacterium]
MKDPLLQRLETVRSPAIVVVGDLMLDLYVWGAVERVSPEAPVQVLKVESEEPRPGGAGNVAANLAALGARVFCCGITGDDANGRRLVQLLKNLKVDTSGILKDKTRPTTVKTRMIAHGQQLLRVDRETAQWLDESLQTAMLERITGLLPKMDALLISDYGKGAIPDSLISRVIALCNEHGKPVLVDPARQRDYRCYKGCTVLKPNKNEAAEASGIDIHDNASLQRAGARLRKMTGARDVVITQGAEGLTILGKTTGPVHVTGLARPVFDITGAGDTVLSLLGYVLAVGGTIDEAAHIANVAASIVVGKVGAAAVTKGEIIRELLGLRHIASHKVKSFEEIATICKEHRRRRQKVVFTNGCFDLLHVGHVKLFQFAKNNGEVLVVGLNSDASVRKLKGAGRPVLTQDERAFILSAIEQVDYIVIFGDDTPLRLIRAVRPDVLVKGADYTKDTVVGRDFVESYGGRVELAPLVEGTSSSGIMSRIINGSATER